MKRLAIVTTHPIQYNAPWFKLLAERKKLIIKIFYTWGQLEHHKKYDPGFGISVEWDIPLLDGYDYTFVQNVSSKPGTHHFNGIINPTLINEINEWNANSILVFGWSFNSHLKCLRYFHKKIPVFFRGDSTLLDEQGTIKKYLRSVFLKWVYSFVDKAFYVGSNNRRYFIQYGLKPDQLIYAPHAVDNDRFAEPEEIYKNGAIEIRKKLHIEEQDILVLFAGKFEEKKNPLFLLEILKGVSDSRLKLLFVGSGVLLTKIELAATKDERIRIMDFQNQLMMPIIYRAADLFILPSKGPNETWGLALNEAMASGKAVVSTFYTGAAVDLIENEINGLIIDLDRAKPLETLLIKSLAKRDILIEMGKQSSLKIEAFSFQEIVFAIEETIIASEN